MSGTAVRGKAVNWIVVMIGWMGLINLRRLTVTVWHGDLLEVNDGDHGCSSRLGSFLLRGCTRA